MEKRYKIYADYIGREDGTTVQHIADRHKITRQEVHRAVRSVRSGSKCEFNECVKDLKLHCLWQSKYKPRYVALRAHKRNDFIMDEIRCLYIEMRNDGFSASHIAKITNQDHTTIGHHLRNYDKKQRD